MYFSQVLGPMTGMDAPALAVAASPGSRYPEQGARNASQPAYSGGAACLAA